MAQEVRRQVVSDPLAQQARGQTPDRSMSPMGIRNPGQSAGDAVYRGKLGGLAALGGVQEAVANILKSKQDEWVVKGKMDYMTGMSEAEMLRTGNRYTQQGYETLNSVDQASTWYQNEALAISETTREMDPEQYQKYLMDRRKETLANLPDDPAVRKVYVEAFQEYGPRLAAEQFKAHNEHNRTKNINALSGAAYSSAPVNEDASRVMPGGPLRVSPGVVSPAIQSSAEDRDVGIRTMLGEAGGEGELGMAAVAHVLKNRAIDGGYGGSTIKGVSLAPQQFSAWNKGPGGIPAIRNYSPDSKAYQRAAKVYDTVMQGHHADPTGGATHYYSPKGMELLVKQGAQKNLVPGWWGKVSAQGSVTIGGHKFGGKARNLQNFISREPLAPPAGMTAEQDYFGTQEEFAGNSDYRQGVMPDAVGMDPVQTEVPAPAALQPVQGTSQIRATFDASNLRDEDKSIAAADAMIRSLEEGSDQVYNDLGGEGYLRELNADPATINAVQAARTKQVKGQQDKFNVDTERQVEDFKSAIKSGEFKTTEDVLVAVNTLQDVLGQDEQWAHSLANEVLAEFHKVTEDDKALQPQMAADLAGIHRQLTEDPTYTADEAAAAAMKLGEQYDIDGKTVQGWVVDMHRRDASRKDKMLTEMQTLKKKQDKEDATKAQVQSALKGNSGLAAVKGNVTVTDKNGHEVEVDAAQYGVQLLKQSEIDNVRSSVDNKKITPEQGAALVNRNVYEKLAKHDVIDTEHAAEITGALKGDFSGVGGKVTPEAVEAFDFWLQGKTNPNIGPAYMARMVTDPDVRELLNVAEVMYGGQQDIETALRKAHMRINQKDYKPEQRIGMNERFQAKVGAGVDKAIENVMWPGWFSSDAYTDKDRESINAQRGRMREDVINRANMYHVLNPVVDPEAHIKMAIEDFENDAVVISGSLVLGSTQRGTRIDQVMGIDSFGKDAPQRAFHSYMQEFGADLFPNLYNELDTIPGVPGFKSRVRGETTGEFLNNLAFDASPAGALINGIAGWEGLRVWKDIPDYHVEYNESEGTVSIQLWKDDTRKEFVGEPQFVHVKDIGEYWLNSQREPGGFFGAMRSFNESLAGNIQNQRVRDAGAEVGVMP